MSIKLFPIYGILLFVAALSYAAYHGRAHAVTKDALMLAHHRDGVEWSAWTLLLTVGLIVMARHSIGPVERPDIFWVHLPLALTAAGLLLAIILRYDGERARPLHRWLAYPCLGSFVAALATGLVMLWQM